MRIRISTLVILGILALLHAYIGSRILPGLQAGAVFTAFGIAWLAASFVLIPAGLLSHAIRRQPLADRVHWAGMLALGMFSSLLVLTFVRDLVLGAAALAGAGNAALATWSAAAVPALAALATLAGFLNARRTAAVVDVDVPIAGLPDGLHGFTIAQISDIHVGPTIKRGYLDPIVDAVNALEADVIAVTGDLVDGSVRRLAQHTAPLARLRARHGAYFVTGNHDYYSNAQEWIPEVRRLGLKVLLNEHVVLDHRGASLLLAGAPDDVGAKILLAHQPRSAHAAADAGFDLQLSGHTHGGQFLPWNFFVTMQQPYVAGLKRLRNMWIYISRGTGYWGPPKRFGAPSEITRVRLVRA
jgi:predicted MPP superfamily phosphohydrolase